MLLVDNEERKGREARKESYVFACFARFAFNVFYMCLIMASANSDVFSSVAPSIRRAKS
jgi:hypothetical protein